MLHSIHYYCNINYVGAKSSVSIWYDYKYPYRFYNVECLGNETNFFGCQYDTTGSCYYSSYAVAVFCHESKYIVLVVVYM